MNRLMMLLGLALVAGCEKRPEPRAVPIRAAETKYVLAMVYDYSPSYAGQHAKMHAAALELLSAVTDEHGEDARIVLGQISGGGETITWEGSPADFKRSFGDLEEFDAFMRKHTNPAGSRVYDSLADVLDFLNGLPEVASGKAGSVLVGLTDMENNIGDPEGSHQRLLKALRKYASTGGGCGLYFVTQSLVQDWERQLRAAGFRPGHFVVEGHKKPRITPPSF